MKLLVITHEPLGERLAGPAIRAWELAAVLAGEHAVTLTSPYPVTRRHPAFAVTSFADQDAALLRQAAQADVIVLQGLMLYGHPRLAELGKHLVVDLYDPFVFESLPQLEGPRAMERHRELLLAMDHQLHLGDFFLCANERQRDMYLGRLCALGRLTPALFEQDPAMARLLAVVPFGLPAEPPQAKQRLLRGVRPGIAEDDTVLLWGGGIWSWFDAPTVIQAVARSHPRVKLVFMGLAHPNPAQPRMAMAARALDLARELGVLDRQVFFNEGWVGYDERASYLLEADAGVSAHFDSIETRFAFRTRVLDYLWGGLPVLTTTGDAMAELVAREGLGAVLGYGDVDGWVRAIAELHDHPGRRAAMRERVAAVAPRYRWPVAAAPLLRYAAAPYHTPPALLPGPGYGPPRTLWAKSAAVLRHQGPGELLRRAGQFVAKRAGRGFGVQHPG